MGAGRGGTGSLSFLLPLFSSPLSFFFSSLLCSHSPLLLRLALSPPAPLPSLLLSFSSLSCTLCAGMYKAGQVEEDVGRVEAKNTRRGKCIASRRCDEH